MKNSLFWKKRMIPVYFLVAILDFCFYQFYLKTNVMMTLNITFPLIVLGFISIGYNYRWKKEQDEYERQLNSGNRNKNDA
ncbi:hypothetical protein [Priestia koreensis]|uniref:hypothetical protein n=1 Tax=Priestia koreensis TaxID=284581 RepID=UPI001F565DFE|nr:hypothetical protein [Priestia koreensis]MCM3004157.1 hypothetical protein [Priestia koreensis]UNL83374.1 hypothetical protein IE339_14475 [Priestia koreensis]